MEEAEGPEAKKEAPTPMEADAPAPAAAPAADGAAPEAGAGAKVDEPKVLTRAACVPEHAAPCVVAAPEFLVVAMFLSTEGLFASTFLCHSMPKMPPDLMRHCACCTTHFCPFAAVDVREQGSSVACV